jgi:hypothetical protein
MAITNEKVERTSHNQTGAKHKRTELMREWGIHWALECELVEPLSGDFGIALCLL